MASKGYETSRLVLGTAQLGMHYGIANRTGMPDTNAAVSIIAQAWKGGVNELDTGQAYGDSETILGSALKDLGIGNRVNIISKFHPKVDHRDSSALRNSVEKSLSRLGITKLHAMLLHREDLLDQWENGLGENLHQFVEEALIGQVGISVYTPPKALQALKTEGINLVQIPGNLLDRRFEKAGVYDEARRRSKSVYIRSVFLQGLLLMDVSELSGSMEFAIPVIEQLVKFSQDTGFSVKQLALGFVKDAYPNHKVVVGCETIEQVQRNLELWQTELPIELVARIQSEFKDTSERVLNPSLWHAGLTTK